jgi:hypothetical protein
MKLTPLCHALAPFLLLVACGTDESGQRGQRALPDGALAPVGTVSRPGAAAYRAHDAPRAASFDLDASVLRAQVNSIDAAIRQERDLRRASGPTRLRGRETPLHRRAAPTSLALR